MGKGRGRGMGKGRGMGRGMGRGSLTYWEYLQWIKFIHKQTKRRFPDGFSTIKIHPQTVKKAICGLIY